MRAHHPFKGVCVGPQPRSFHGTQEVQVSNLMPRLLFPASGDESLPVPWDFWMQPGPSFHGKLLEVPVLGREEGKLEGQVFSNRRRDVASSLQ